MARISRKTMSAPQKTGTLSAERVYNTCLYLRLSKENSGTDSTDSIEMQEYLLEQYVKTRQDMKLAAVYRDNGASGTNFDRSGFEQMMDAVRKRTIDCIVVKDLSRFGRNYVETGYYLEKIFPFLGVRFVAVNDCYDTLTNRNGDELAASMKNIVNSLFAKDISKKCGSALRRKQEKGEFIGSWAPYGYLKSPDDKHKLIPDAETAPVVCKIFAWRSEGLSYAAIARKLNEQKTPCPTMIRFVRGAFKKANPSSVGRLWAAQTIKNITGNMAYVGHMAQGKQFRSLCDGVPNRQTAKKDWMIVRNTHEAIVRDEVWERVQSINQKAETPEKGRYL